MKLLKHLSVAQEKQQLSFQLKNFSAVTKKTKTQQHKFICKSEPKILWWDYRCFRKSLSFFLLLASHLSGCSLWQYCKLFHWCCCCCRNSSYLCGWYISILHISAKTLPGKLDDKMKWPVKASLIIEFFKVRCPKFNLAWRVEM